MENVKVTNLLIVADENAPKTKVYIGKDKAQSGFFAYSEFLRKQEYARKPKEAGEYKLLANKKTGELIGIWLRGQHKFDVAEFLFKTDWIPVGWDQNQALTEEDIEKAQNLLEKETQKAIDLGEAVEKNPLILVDHIGKNNYLTWDICGKKYLYVLGYKADKGTYFISDEKDPSWSVCRMESKYAIYTPSDEFIKALDLNLYSSVWNSKMTSDRWYKRPCKVEISAVRNLLSDEWGSLYEDAIALINRSREEDLGLDAEFERLEKRVSRIEKMCIKGLPEVLIDNEATLIIRSISEIEDGLKRIR